MMRAPPCVYSHVLHRPHLEVDNVLVQGNAHSGKVLMLAYAMQDIALAVKHESIPVISEGPYAEALHYFIFFH